ncbi:MAG: NAD(P)-binding domain-containing protein [Parachlamydiales bacterium]|jgi:cation diffusion facilitator CzcD-associated flavoprotein CzcO
MKNEALEILKEKIFQQLDCIEFPPASWIINPQKNMDVAVIGAGMAGISAAFALLKQGIVNFQIFETAKEGEEGPWTTYARMNLLRSGKELTGPAYDFPLLTFRAWYEAQFGENGWEKLYKIPRAQWMQYLIWFREVLNLPVNNGFPIQKIDYDGSNMQLFSNGRVATASKIILATGRGSAQIPAFMSDVPKKYYAHTLESIDFKLLINKRLGVVGAGASAFDAAATALEAGAASATIVIRHEDIPRVNKSASLIYPGFLEGYYYLTDKQKIEFMREIRSDGTPPPHEAIERISKQPHFHFERGAEVEAVQVKDEKIQLETAKGTKSFDYLILATGFINVVPSQPLLTPFVDDFFSWKDKEPTSNPKFNGAPYLGPHFQLIPKTNSNREFLKNIYCFNHSAALSHGIISSDIPGIGIGAHRLARGIVIDFFTQNSTAYFQQLRQFKTLELPYELI